MLRRSFLLIRPGLFAFAVCAALLACTNEDSNDDSAESPAAVAVIVDPDEQPVVLDYSVEELRPSVVDLIDLGSATDQLLVGQWEVFYLSEEAYVERFVTRAELLVPDLAECISDATGMEAERAVVFAQADISESFGIGTSDGEIQRAFPNAPTDPLIQDRQLRLAVQDSGCSTQVGPGVDGPVVAASRLLIERGEFVRNAGLEEQASAAASEFCSDGSGDCDDESGYLEAVTPIFRQMTELNEDALSQ